MCSTKMRNLMWFLLLMISTTVLRSRIVDCFSASLLCNRMPGLSPPQRQMCIEAPDAVSSLAHGQVQAAAECEHQFKGHRWNCSRVWRRDSFGHIMVVGSREASFVYAIATAGAVHSITAACSKGNISNCGCDPMPRNSNPIFQQQSWKWGGCSADIAYGMKFSRKFLDVREVEGDTRSLMNLQNNRVGRKIVKHLLRTDCKCHGVSGSCAMKTCWRTLPPLRVVGDTLMRKYHKARLVAPQKMDTGQGETMDKEQEGDSAKINQLRLVYKRRNGGGGGGKANPKKVQTPKRLELVYIQPSPNYCDEDVSLGSYGTFGRQCNRNRTKGVDGCDLLCCGRGFNTHQIKRNFPCKCKFRWCCDVLCDECFERIEKYTCK